MNALRLLSISAALLLAAATGSAQIYGGGTAPNAGSGSTGATVGSTPASGGTTKPGTTTAPGTSAPTTTATPIAGASGGTGNGATVGSTSPGNTATIGTTTPGNTTSAGTMAPGNTSSAGTPAPGNTASAGTTAPGNVASGGTAAPGSTSGTVTGAVAPSTPGVTAVATGGGSSNPNGATVSAGGTTTVTTPATATAGTFNPAGDIATLNALLALQNLQSAFFTEGLQRFSAADFANAALGCSTLAIPTATLLQSIRSQTATQIGALQSAISSLGGTAVTPCTYNFGMTTPQAFLSSALTIGNTASSAYATLVASIADPVLRRQLATTAAVLARQSAYLDVLNASSPFPNPYEPVVTATDIQNAVGKFVASCNGGGFITLPTAATTAVAGPKALTVTVSKQVTLEGSLSSGQKLSFQWTNAAGGLTASISNANSATPTVSFTQGRGKYNFLLTVTNSSGVSAIDELTVQYIGN